MSNNNEAYKSSENTPNFITYKPSTVLGSTITTKNQTTMKTLIIVLLVSCAGLAFENIPKNSLSADGGLKIDNQTSSTTHPLKTRTGLRLTKIRKRRTTKPADKEIKSVVVFKATLREVLERYGLAFLLKIIRQAKVQLNGGLRTTIPCFVTVAYHLALVNGEWVWIQGVELICP